MHRKFFDGERWRWVAWLLAVALWFGGSPAGHAKPRAPEVPTDWPGVVFRLSGMERLSGNRLLVRIRIVNQSPPETPRVTVEGDGPDEVMYWTNDAGQQEVASRVRPAWKIRDAAVWEEKQGVKLQPVPREKGDPYPGRDRVFRELAPGEAVEVGAIYQLVPEAEVIRIDLPRAGKPMAGIHLPEPPVPPGAGVPQR